MPPFIRRLRREPEEGSQPPIELSGRTKWTISTANFWTLITILGAGLYAWSDMKSDNRVRDLSIDQHSTQIALIDRKLGVVDAKVTDTREILIRVSAQLDSIQKEQSRLARAAAGRSQN